MAKTRIYRQFCPVARSLEMIGEKWSLLIVRDLIEGPQRFSDLLRFNSGITPKWLTLRLHDPLRRRALAGRARRGGSGGRPDRDYPRGLGRPADGDARRAPSPAPDHGPHRRARARRGAGRHLRL